MMIEKIGLGTVQFGMSYGISNKKGQTPANEVTKILDSARVLGITVLDSASGYGMAEEVLGQNDLSSFSLVSKYLPPAAGEKVSKQLYESLKNLKKNSLYAYLAHRPLDLLRDLRQWDELQALKREGLVRKIGFSLNDPEELDELLAVDVFPDLVQVPYNFFDRRFEGSMKYLKTRGCEIHTRSTFLQGLFFMDPSVLNDFFDEIKPRLASLQMKEGPLAGNLLKFSLEQAFVDKVIMGVETKQQLSENINNLKKAISLPQQSFEISAKILKPSLWPAKQQH